MQPLEFIVLDKNYGLKHSDTSDHTVKERSV